MGPGKTHPTLDAAGSLLHLRGRDLEISGRALVMGVLNVTPDSFSDGGLFRDPAAALARASKMIRDGADIIDVGGESSRPGAEPVGAAEEIRRVLPVIELIRRAGDVPISIDTYKAQVAREALAAGADIINDISALRFDRAMAPTAAEAGCPVVLMHIKGTPRDMQRDPVYTDVVGEIKDFLAERIEFARSAGIDAGQTIIDPGIGFGKRLEHNLSILARLAELVELGRPVLVGPSRKSFIGEILGGVPAVERLEGTSAAVAAAIAAGAKIVRVHDVKQMRRVADVAGAIARARASGG